MPVSDQAFPEHWLAQVPVPDRSAALGAPGFGGHQPLEPMLQAMGKLAALGAQTVAVACNTAHQAADPGLGQGGTYAAGLYDEALLRAGMLCHVPDALEKAELMRGIYDGVKVGDMVLARRCFTQVAEALARRNRLDVLILGCTEIPLALGSVPGMPRLELVDPAALLARKLAERAYGSDKSAYASAYAE